MLSKPPTTSFSSSSWSYSGSSSSSTHRAKTKGNSADTELEYSHPAPVSAFDGNQSVRQSPSPPPLSSRPPIPSPSARGSIASPTEAYPTSSRLEEDVTTATPPPPDLSASPHKQPTVADILLQSRRSHRWSAGGGKEKTGYWEWPFAIFSRRRHGQRWGNEKNACCNCSFTGQ